MRYVVFLRGINVGGRTIRMADLRQCFAGGGFRNVLTVLQTGNVIIDCDMSDTGKLRAEIEDLLKTTFDYPAQVIVVRDETLREIINKYPFVGADANEHRYVIFVDGSTEGLLDDMELDPKLEAVEPGDGVIYWKVQKGRTLDSGFAKLMPKLLAGRFVTNRNLNTLQKILAKV